MSLVQKESAALLLVDVQENLFPQIDRRDEVLDTICFFLQAASVLRLPTVVTEQYPKGLGATLQTVREFLPKNQPILEKSSFSAYSGEIAKMIDAIEAQSWIVIGVETHICILQTVRDLIAVGKDVVVLNDATSSRSLYDYSTAIAELRDLGARISNSETILYEMVKDAASAEFKQLLPLIKEYA
ncbi:MAG: hypothetical protein S4CHLAM81_04960 [Chlamydiales bacterium]|nr:hypothetical protein [Chlamydiales bacterium]MCH9635284.1 hypothetical protein [Chlamydiales bacterium]MCH9704250.1 isochorismatase family protein [Chlamydiota bacterium]